MDYSVIKKKLIKKGCEEKIVCYDNTKAINLLENVDAIQRGTIYDYSQNAFVDYQGNPIRNQFGKPII